MREKGINISNSAITTTPGTAATVILFDTTADPGKGTTLARRRAYPNVSRATVRILADQACTFFADDLTANSTTWRTMNGAGLGEATTANTWFERNVLLVGDDLRLKVVTPAGAITVWEVSVKLWPNSSLAQ